MLLCCSITTKDEHTFRCDLSNQIIVTVTVTDVERPCLCVREKKKGRKIENKNEPKKNNTGMNDKESSSYAPTVLKRTGAANGDGWWVEDVVVV